MRSFIDDDLVKIVRDHFMNDPRMGRLCDALAYRSEDWSGDLLKDVAARHPDRKVRGEATYALGMWWRFGPDTMILGRDHSESVTRQCLAEAKRFFTQVCEDYADATSTDGTFRPAVKARAELARIANLPNLKVGKVAPEITGEDLYGKPLKLSDHRGKVVVVCFWSTWCGPCMAMIPHERALVKRMEGKPFALLGVNSDEADDCEKAKQATREKQMTWPSWWDGGFRGAIQTAYDVAHWPTVYVLDPEGVIRYVDVRGENLDRAVDTLLAEMEARTKNARPDDKHATIEIQSQAFGWVFSKAIRCPRPRIPGTWHSSRADWNLRLAAGEAEAPFTAGEVAGAFLDDRGSRCIGILARSGLVQCPLFPPGGVLRCGASQARLRSGKLRCLLV